ncbi:MAG TPA: hypothetical protein VHE14_05695 [Solirubrobacteraceae bacterium]|nr:hypothetical protein [Solirubrobacteraceae bacterium]
MNTLRELRKLVLGETWTLPLGVAGALGIAAGLRALAGSNDWWRDGGGVVLALLVLVVLVLSLRSKAR